VERSVCCSPDLNATRKKEEICNTSNMPGLLREGRSTVILPSLPVFVCSTSARDRAAAGVCADHFCNQARASSCSSPCMAPAIRRPRGPMCNPRRDVHAAWSVQQEPASARVQPWLACRARGGGIVSVHIVYLVLLATYAFPSSTTAIIWTAYPLIFIVVAAHTALAH
jgi:hypothetical protein